VVVGISNGDLAELLTIESLSATDFRQKALKRAARSAFLWPEEASNLLDQGRSLTELHCVGPFVAEKIQGWIEHPPQQAGERDPLRRDFLTLANARNILARDATWLQRLRGDIHMHTNWSDGSGTVAEMAEAGESRGYEYIAITDHSKGLKIAGGIDEADLLEQGAEIVATNEARRAAGSKLTVLRSTEMNLNPRGDGDMDWDSLGRLDLVLGSFHSALRLKDDQTDRYIAALRNPDLHVLGHPRGRVYNYRIGLSADWPRVFAEAARLDKAVEIDCYPDRQDLNVELLRRVRDAGARVSLGTDAHHAWQLEFIELGVAAALEAGIPPEKIINFLPIGELQAWVAELRASVNQRESRCA
jgi:histidinol phosphatase-like PHP family hydrolase